MSCLRRALAALCVASLMSPCGSVQAAVQPESKVETRLIFSNMPADSTDAVKLQNFADVFLWSGLEKFKTPADDSRLRAACFGDPTDDAFLGAILGFLVGPAINLVSDTVKSELDNAVKAYTGETKASEQASFYAPAAGGERVQAWRCFRVTRTTTTPASTPSGSATRTLDFDFIGEMAVVGSGDRLTNIGDHFEDAYGVKVRPLRAYLGKPIAKGSKLGMSATIAVDAVWREGGTGKQATLFTAPLMEHKFTRGPNGDWSTAPYYFPRKDQDGNEKHDAFPSWASTPLEPLVPFSSGGPGGSVVTLSTTFTEVGDGDGKAVVKLIDSLFGKAQSDLNTAAAKAAKQLVDPAQPTPPAKPDLFCGTITPKTNGATIQWSKTNAASCP